MEKMKIPEINLTSDSEDLIDEYWFTSPGASFDGCSVNSIPWANDVVKQNQEQWEQVERMFYGEENLPTNDIKLRNEIIEWTQHFPYFRISGQQMPINFSYNVMDNDPNYEEIFAIHPAIQFDNKSAIVSYENRSQDQYHRHQDDTITANETLVNDIEKCLRITSGPLLSRRAQSIRTAYDIQSIIPSNQPETNFTQNRNKNGLKSALVSVRSNYDIGRQFGRKLYGSFDVDRLQTVPYSARFIKIPTLKYESGVLNTSMTTNQLKMFRIKTATLVPITRPLRNSITLPAINIESKYFERNSNDAISALIYQNKSTKLMHSSKKSTKKRSESE